MLEVIGQLQPPAGIFLRHNVAPCWCGAGGDWLDDRRRAIRFPSNIDGLVYCQALGLRGVLIAFDDRGQEIYRLNVNAILEAVLANPSAHTLFGSRQ